MREIEIVNDLFTPRNRGVPAQVAVLVSHPTIRLCAAEKRADAIRMREAADCLQAVRLPVKAIFDEWGQTRADALVPQTANKRLGKGRVIYLKNPPPPAQARTLYAKIASKLGIRPSCRLTEAVHGEDVPEVECYPAQKSSALAQKSSDSAGFILINGGLSPRAVRLLPQAVGAGLRHWTDGHGDRRTRADDGGGRTARPPPPSPPRHPARFGGDRPPIQSVGTGPQSVGTGPMGGDGKVAENAFFTSLSAWNAENSGADLSTAPYWVDPDDIAFVNLRAAANGSLEKAIHSVPWGRQTWGGIPFALIRIDQNGNRSGICLCLDGSGGPVPTTGPVPTAGSVPRVGSGPTAGSVPVEGEAGAIDFLLAVEGGVWRTVRIPLRRLVAADAAELTRLSVQFLPFASERTDYRLRGVRIE